MVYCSALNCQNATSGVYKNNTVTFYGFPLQNKPLLKQWLHNMGRDMGTPSKHQRLCSKHFEESSFETDPLKVRKNRRLLKEAVPKKFLLGDDGTWLVGAPRGFCAGISNRTRKRLRDPELSWVPGMLDDVTCGRQPLEEGQEELSKEPVRERDESSAALGKGTMISSELQSHTKRSESPQLCGSLPGGSRDLTQQTSDEEVTSKSLWNSAARQAGPAGSSRGAGSPGAGEPDEFRETLFQGRPPAAESLGLCVERRETSELRIGLVKHQQIHPQRTRVSSYICTECGKSFGRHADLIRHQRTHSGERPYKCSECEKSFTEKPRLTNHLRTHNVHV